MQQQRNICISSQSKVLANTLAGVCMASIVSIIFLLKSHLSCGVHQTNVICILCVPFVYIIKKAPASYG